MAEVDPHKSEVLKYLRNLSAKFHYMCTKVENLDKRLDKIETILMSGFRATGTAFKQTKEVVQAVVNETRDVREDLAEYGGVIESSTYFDPLMRTRCV